MVSEAFTHSTVRQGQMSLKKILCQSKFWIINQDLSKKLGIPATLFLSELLDKFEYHENNKDLISHKGEDGYFFVTIESIEEKFGYGEWHQRKIIEILQNYGIIKQSNFGMPSKRYFKIYPEILIKFMDEILVEQGIVPCSTSVSSLATTCTVPCPPRNCTLGEHVPVPYICTNNRYTNNRITNKNIDALSDANVRQNVRPRSTSSPRAIETIKFNFSSWTFEGIQESDLETWKKLYDKVDVERELLKMQEWIKSNPTKSKKLWRRFITTWLNRSQERQYDRGSYHSTAQDRQRSQFELRHLGFQKDNSPRDPSMVLDCSDWKPEDEKR